MKTKIEMFIGLILLVTLTTIAHAQGVSGIATYQYSAKVDIRIDSTKMDPEMYAKLKSDIQKQSQKEFNLTFNNENSSWKEVESLGAQAGPGGGHTISLAVVGGNSSIYKNMVTGVVEEETELMGRLFLVRDTLKTFNWKFTDETKMVGVHSCQKAVYELIRDKMKFSAELKTMETVKDTLLVEAWFTPNIPVSNGPENYWGLPGLILELNAGGRKFICTKLVLNPSTPVKIDWPQKGKLISRNDFLKLEAEKQKEMISKYKPRPNGEAVEIRIGG